MPSKDFIMPQPDILNELEYGRFVLANLAAMRAKQIKEGAPPLVRIESSHPLSIALAEIAEGKIKPIFKELEEISTDDLDMDALDVETQEEDADVADIDLQLPALDSDEEDTVSAEALDVDDLDEDSDGDGGLGDLLDEDGDEEDDGEISDEISLEDLAEEEESTGDD